MDREDVAERGEMLLLWGHDMTDKTLASEFAISDAFDEASEVVIS